MKLFFNLLMTVSLATGQFIVSINKASLPSLQKRPASSKPVDLPAAGRSADGGLLGEGIQFAIGKTNGEFIQRNENAKGWVFETVVPKIHHQI